jgi:ubiquinone/menaquinone biosynthesis C-methylase UbiE
MICEIDLLKNYPKANRDLSKRAADKTEADRMVARKFGKDFFDGDRRHGYGGFTYNQKFWTPVVPDFQRHFNLTSNDKILDVGCAKGFMLKDFSRSIPGINVSGIDISDYAIENSLLEMKPFLKVANAKSLPFENDEFDLVISINTVHNLELAECAQALQEIERVSKRGSFITVDAYRNDEEKERMMAWNLTAKTIMSVVQWKEFFSEIGYTGDYYWFIP